MQDGIIKGTGNSRYLKGAGWPATYEEFKSMAEAGTLPIDLAGINAAGWQQIGTALSKGNLLSDATAAKYFTSVTGAETVDQVLSLLGRFQRGLGNEYVWRKTQIEDQNLYDSASQTNYDFSSGSLSYYVTYSDSISVNYSTGIFTLNNPSTVVIGSVESDANCSTILGKYCIYGNGVSTSASVVLVDQNATFVKNSTARTLQYSNATVLSDARIEQVTVDYGYVNSPDSATYPPTVSDGYTYTLLGQIGAGAHFEAVEWVGTGTYGSSSPTVITFSNRPKYVLLFMVNGSFPGASFSFTAGMTRGAYAPQVQIVNMDNVETSYAGVAYPNGNSSYTVYVKRSDDYKTLYIYDTLDARDQMNGSGENNLAIGLS